MRVFVDSSSCLISTFIPMESAMKRTFCLIDVRRRLDGIEGAANGWELEAAGGADGEGE